jgi:hypothetical protein
MQNFSHAKKYISRFLYFPDKLLPAYVLLVAVRKLQPAGTLHAVASGRSLGRRQAGGERRRQGGKIRDGIHFNAHRMHFMT